MAKSLFWLSDEAWEALSPHLSIFLKPADCAFETFERRLESTNFVEKLSLESAAMCVSGGCQRGKAGPLHLIWHQTRAISADAFSILRSEVLDL
jgi:hypothetical protein